MHHAELVKRIRDLGVAGVEVHHLGEILAGRLSLPLSEMQLAEPVVAIGGELPVRIGFDHPLEGSRGLIKCPIPHQVEGCRVGLLLGFAIPIRHAGSRCRSARRQGARSRIADSGLWVVAQRHQALVQIDVLGLLVLSEAFNLKPELLHHAAQGLQLALQNLELMEQRSNAGAWGWPRLSRFRLRSGEGCDASRRNRIRLRRGPLDRHVRRRFLHRHGSNDPETRT